MVYTMDVAGILAGIIGSYVLPPGAADILSSSHATPNRETEELKASVER